MIALVATLLLAAYALGPDLLSRWILGFVVPRKSLILSKSEEITRGILWSLGPACTAWSLRHIGPFSFPSNAKIDLQTFFSSLYSESFFNQHSSEFFASAASFWQLNVCLCIRMYLIVLIASSIVNVLILQYGRMRKFLEKRTSWYCKVARWILATFVLPRIAEWHLILSPVLLHSRKMSIEIDILAKNGILYAGGLADKMLGPSGDLQSVTLAKARRFKRDEYLKAKEIDPHTIADGFWTNIPGEMFVVVASEISTINVRHIPHMTQFTAKYDDLAKILSEIRRTLKNQHTEKQ